MNLKMIIVPADESKLIFRRYDSFHALSPVIIQGMHLCSHDVIDCEIYKPVRDKLLSYDTIEIPEHIFYEETE